MLQTELILAVLGGFASGLFAAAVAGVACRARRKGTPLQIATPNQTPVPEQTPPAHPEQDISPWEMARNTAGDMARDMAPRDKQGSLNKLARLQAIRQGRTLTGPRGEELYMIASECIVFRGTADQCFDFLSDRGIIPFASAIEPLDLRIDYNLSVLGVGVVDYWGAERRLDTSEANLPDQNSHPLPS